MWKRQRKLIYIWRVVMIMVARLKTKEKESLVSLSSFSHFCDSTVGLNPTTNNRTWGTLVENHIGGDLIPLCRVNPPMSCVTDQLGCATCTPFKKTGIK